MSVRMPSSRDETLITPCFIFTVQIPHQNRRCYCRNSEEAAVTHLSVATVTVVPVPGCIGVALPRTERREHSDAAKFRHRFVSSGNPPMYLNTNSVTYVVRI